VQTISAIMALALIISFVCLVLATLPEIRATWGGSGLVAAHVNMGC
jgi:hypothetical protein